MPEGDKSPQRAEAQRLAESLLQSNTVEVLQELRRVLEERLPRSPPGRQKGKEIVDDSARVRRAEELMASGQAAGDEDAAHIAAHEDPGGNERATRRRLLDKLRKRQAERSQERTPKDEILERAFAEHVEQWDL